MNREGYIRKQSWHNLRNYPGICLKEMKKSTKASGTIASLVVGFCDHGDELEVP
jgi:hypothetical protein